MEYMKTKCDQFKNCDATVNFIRIINDVFDVINSSTSESKVGFKRPITKTTANELFARFDDALEYLPKLKVEGESKSIFNSSSSTTFIGFYNDMLNFKRMYADYVECDKIDALVAHRFCQDHIESFFGSIRSMGGKLIYDKMSGRFMIKCDKISFYCSRI